MDKKIVCAYASDHAYKVGTIGPFGEIHALGNVRTFPTFEEADQVAKDLSKGKYPDIISKPCRYVNMR